MQHHVTAGRILVGRTVQIREYEPKRAEVELSFSLPDECSDEDASKALVQVTNMAVTKLHEILGLAPPDAPSVSCGTPPAARGRGKGKVVETAGPEDPKAKMVAASEAAAKVKSVPDPEPAPEPKAADDGMGLDDIFGADPEPAAPVDIPDADLLAAVQKKNAEITNPTAIRQLVGSYVKPPAGVRDIPKEQRVKFLAELSALTKAG